MAFRGARRKKDHHSSGSSRRRRRGRGRRLRQPSPEGELTAEEVQQSRENRERRRAALRARSRASGPDPGVSHVGEAKLRQQVPGKKSLELLDFPLSNTAPEHMACDADSISLISYNSLHPARGEDGEVFFARRRNRTLPELSRACKTSVDIMCLQEIDQLTYKELRLATFFANRGYESTYNERRELLTVWRSDRFELRWHENRSRTLVTGLRFIRSATESFHLNVVNCHLEGAPLRVRDRIVQLSSTLRSCNNRSPCNAGTVIIGDFNCISTGAEIKFLTRKGMLEPTIYRDRYFSKYARPQDALHGFDSFTSAYDTCEHLRKMPTFGHARCAGQLARIDHVMFDTRYFALAGACTTANGAIRAEMERIGCPNHLHGSDHLPIGVKLQIMANAAEVARADPSLKTTSEGFSLNSDPLGRALRWELETLLRRAPQSPKRPTPEEIRMLKRHGDQVREFVARLSPSQRSWVKWRKSRFKKAVRQRRSPAGAAAAAAVTAVLLPQPLSKIMAAQGQELLRQASGDVPVGSRMLRQSSARPPPRTWRGAAGENGVSRSYVGTATTGKTKQERPILRARSC